MDFAKYASFTTTDLLADDDFVAAVLRPTAESTYFWQQVAERYPAVQVAMTEATSVIRAYRTQDTFSNQARQAAVWQRIAAEIGPVARPTRQLPLPLPRRRLARVLRAAAVALPVGLGSFALWYNQEQRFQTAFGELKTVVLPDGTSVLLNGNSVLTYQRGWGKNSREVWLQGEGFFRVVHLNTDPAHIKPTERFVVHCYDLSIEVLGTTFNVHNRRKKVDVGLVSGKIKLTDTAATAPTSLVLAPGDYVEYAAHTITAKQKLAHPEKLTTWSKRQFVFTNARLVDILQTLEDSYGYQIKYADNAIKQLKIEGEIQVTGVAPLLEIISTSLHVNIYQNGKQIIVH
ncbi:FecR family protein [Hymenobacter defluvii]|uniref:FecR domain-containing protein n=1 Tax=Hymenobacter defluvii TaxID=2054411 RepID=A0ABS3T9D7_9BACT|nr:FecR domain-containing protein [Hymenobacter defluvii]MBO3269385.1 FecR domain-containing protein [Hymenobacter defluvii]